MKYSSVSKSKLSNSKGNSVLVKLLFVSKTNLAADYPSEFYDEINVSNSDIDNRLQEIQSLLTEELDVVSNLIEAPSKLIKKSSNPTLEDGNVGDFYMNMQNGSVFGPKTETGW